MKDSVPNVDRRRVNLRNTSTPAHLPRFRSLQEWLEYAKEVREHILSVCGLLPMPNPAPLKAHVFGTIEYPDYAVSKVYFQSYPGLLVTGNMYSPRGRKGPFPAVLNPHGHWNEGRLVDCERGSLPARGITFARQGYVAFCYDMIGYNDATQLDHPQDGRDTAQQELWGFSLMALQTYNSIRAVDFLQSLPTVDPERIGCTGESGGGTQTFILTAVDDRIKVSAPVNMISAHFQGGCLCENVPSLRLETSNPVIAALMAPRPMMLISATGDWTKNTPTVEYPYINSIYRLFGAADRLEQCQIDAGHNYNLASRNAVYPFFAKWLLGAENPEEFQEKPYRLEPKKRYLVWADRERPRYAPEGDKLIHSLVKRKAATIQERWPQTKREFNSFSEQMGTALKHLLSVELPTKTEVQHISLGKVISQGVTREELVLSRKSIGDRIQAVLLKPPAAQRSGHAVLVVSSDMGGVGEGVNSALVSGLLDVGHQVLNIDCWGIGKAQLPANYDEAVAGTAFYLTYNRSDTVNRVQDILTALAYLQSLRGVERISLIGQGDAGLWAVLARSQASFVGKTIADLGRFDARKDEAYQQRLFIPALRSIGGIETAIALIAPGSLSLHNSGKNIQADAVSRAYAAAGAKRALTIDEHVLPESEIIQLVK